MVSSSSLFVFSFLNVLGAAQSTFTPARPPAIPLAVKSPYLQCWQLVGSDGGDGGYLAGEWPAFWNGKTTSWTGLIRVDGVPYIWMGDPSPGDISNASLVTQTSFEYTSTRSVFHQVVPNKVAITATFLSPITPNDYMRTSLISSYLQVDVTSLDGQDHGIQLYTDITAEWVSGDRNATVEWDYDVVNNQTTPDRIDIASSYPTHSQTASKSNLRPFGTQIAYTGWSEAVTHTAATFHETTPSATQPTATVAQGKRQASENSTTTSSASASAGTCSAAAAGPIGTEGVAYHKIYRQTQLAFSEVNDQTEYGYWYYMTANTSILSFQSGQDDVIRAAFASNGTLANTQDTNYRAISDDYPTFAYALNFGCTQNASALFTINLNQQDAIQFEGDTGNVSLPSLWTDYFDTDLDADVFFYNDYETVSGLATTFDNQVASDSAAAAGDNYTVITSLAARQAFGGLQLVNTTAAPYLFLKEISSDGNIQTVDVLFPWHPIAIYANPTLLKLALEPLFINQEAGHWPFAFSIHDLGNHYPNATGHDDGQDEQQPLEECGNMLIMSLAYAQRNNDNSWLSSHYDILRQWNEYLVEEALIPASQISTDDFAGALVNQTNLAIKGIVGIEAMAQIANRTGHAEDGANYTQIAHNYLTQWLTLSAAANATVPHTTLNYGNDSTYSLLYNIFPDKELGLELIPHSTYDQQSAFYPTVADTYGVPLDTRHTYTKADWQIFCAAVANDSTRALFIDDISNWVSDTPTDLPFGDLYDAITGDYPATVTFADRPVVGGYFAILALNGAPTSGFVTPTGNDTTS